MLKGRKLCLLAYCNYTQFLRICFTGSPSFCEILRQNFRFLHLFLQLSCLQGRTSNDGRFSPTCACMYNAHGHMPSRILETLNAGKNMKCLMALGRTQGKGLKRGCFTTKQPVIPEALRTYRIKWSTKVAVNLHNLLVAKLPKAYVWAVFISFHE